MASKKAAKHGTAGRDGGTVPEIDRHEPAPERRYVDVDPWAMLLEGLMETPEEEPVARPRPKKEVVT